MNVMGNTCLRIFLQGTDSPTQRGVIHNLLALSEASGSHPRGRMAPPLCLGNLQRKWKPKESGPGTCQPGVSGTGRGGVFDCRTLPGQVRSLTFFEKSATVKF